MIRKIGNADTASSLRTGKQIIIIIIDIYINYIWFFATDTRKKINIEIMNTCAMHGSI